MYSFGLRSGAILVFVHDTVSTLYQCAVLFRKRYFCVVSFHSSFGLPMFQLFVPKPSNLFFYLYCISGTSRELILKSERRFCRTSRDLKSVVVEY